MLAMPYMPFINVTLLLSLTPNLQQSKDLKLAKLFDTFSSIPDRSKTKTDEELKKPSNIGFPPVPTSSPIRATTSSPDPFHRNHRGQSDPFELLKYMKNFSSVSDASKAKTVEAFKSTNTDFPEISTSSPIGTSSQLKTLDLKIPFCQDETEAIYTVVRGVSMDLAKRDPGKMISLKGIADTCMFYCRESIWLPCAAVDYNETAEECRLVSDRDYELIPAFDSDLYEKHCVSSRVAAVCPGPHQLHLQTGFQDASHVRRHTVDNLTRCIELCATLQDLGLNCKSGVFYQNKSSENCWLSDKNEREEPSYKGQLIVDDIVDYFDMNCI